MPRAKKSEPAATVSLGIPDELRDQLRRWVEIDALDAKAFWAWLGTVLPALPLPQGSPGRGPPPPELPPGRMRELARDLVDCGADRSRLTMLCARYFEDNQLLTRRVKALEATLRTYRRSGRPDAVANDPEVDAVSERYLPARRKG